MAWRQGVDVGVEDPRGLLAWTMAWGSAWTLAWALGVDDGVEAGR